MRDGGALAARVELAGVHWHWKGRRGRHGRDRPYRPILYRGSLKVPAVRLLYEQHYGLDSFGILFRRWCSDPECVAPAHHIPRRPGRLLCQLVDDVEVRTALCCLIRSQSARGHYSLSGADVAFGMAKAQVEDLAGRLGVLPLAVLAGYGRVVRETRNRERHGGQGRG